MRTLGLTLARKRDVLFDACTEGCDLFVVNTLQPELDEASGCLVSRAGAGQGEHGTVLQPQIVRIKLKSPVGEVELLQELPAALFPANGLEPLVRRRRLGDVLTPEPFTNAIGRSKAELLLCCLLERRVPRSDLAPRIPEELVGISAHGALDPDIDRSGRVARPKSVVPIRCRNARCARARERSYSGRDGDLFCGPSSEPGHARKHRRKSTQPGRQVHPRSAASPAGPFPAPSSGPAPSFIR